jgi:hypothetical protein
MHRKNTARYTLTFLALRKGALPRGLAGNHDASVCSVCGAREAKSAANHAGLAAGHASRCVVHGGIRVDHGRAR